MKFDCSLKNEFYSKKAKFRDPDRPSALVEGELDESPLKTQVYILLTHYKILTHYLNVKNP